MAILRPHGDTADMTDHVASLEIAKLCPKIPVLAPTWKTCGKRGCRCGAGHLHGPYWTLRWREGSLHHRTYVRPRDVAAVRAILTARSTQRRRERQEVTEALTVWRTLRQLTRDVDAQLSTRPRR